MLVEKLGRSSISHVRCRKATLTRLVALSGGRRCNSTSSTSLDGPPVTDTNRAEATMKRFWKDVGIHKRGDEYVVTLDHRPLKTPSGNTMLLPAGKKLLPALIAAEWDNQETLLKPHALPMTSIVSRALDAMGATGGREDVERNLLNFFNTDSVCFFNNNPEPLERLQDQHWVPLIGWARETFDIKINVSNSILPARQPQETKEKLENIIRSLHIWELVALERATIVSKSLIIGLALVKKHLSVEEAALAASVEINSQIERWGEVEDTHDVDYHDIRRQLGSAAVLLSKES